MVDQAIARYHALLDHELAQASQHVLTAGLQARNLFFGTRPLVSVLRPHLFSRAQYELLQHSCGVVGRAARKLAQAQLENPALRALMGFTPLEEQLLAMHPGYAEPSAHSRMDTFLTSDGSSLQFVEYNAESPAAIAYQDELSAVFRELPVMQEFARHYRVVDLPARHRMIETLLSAWHAANCPQGEAMVAIVDWHGLPTASEFELFRDYFESQGLPSTICSPDELEYHDGKLYARLSQTNPMTSGPQLVGPISIVYKRVLTSELLMHYGDHSLEHPLVRAYADGAIVLVNSFRAKLLHKKSIFALLTDDELQAQLDDEERAAVARHVPWTRVVRDTPTSYQGERIDLLRFARANRERLLLKPNDEYGGKGITIGWESDAASWDAALSEALQSPFVIQERVRIAYEPYPALVDGQVQIGQRLVDSDPYLFGTEVEGCLTRLSTVTLLNVTAGGGSTVPTFVIEPGEQGKL